MTAWAWNSRHCGVVFLQRQRRRFGLLGNGDSLCQGKLGPARNARKPERGIHAMELAQQPPKIPGPDSLQTNSNFGDDEDWVGHLQQC